MNDYVVIKLISGEEIMATFIDESDTSIDIKNVLSLHHTISASVEGKRETITISPFCQFTSDHDFTLPKNTVIYIKDLSLELQERYITLSGHYFEGTADTDDFILSDNSLDFNEDALNVIEGNDTVH